MMHYSPGAPCGAGYVTCPVCLNLLRKEDMKEQVLTFPSSLLDQMGRFQGVETSQKYWWEILHHSNTSYIERDVAERDTSLKQLIPYIILEHNKQYLCYKRSPKCGEERLHHKWSIGVGGHINRSDDRAGVGQSAYERGFIRELEEETSLRWDEDDRVTNTIVGCINDDSDDVGKVHFGVVHIVSIAPDVLLRFCDEALSQPTWLRLSEVRELRLENWSRLVVEEILLKS